MDNTEVKRENLIKILEGYVDLLHKEKRRLEIMVGDMEEVEQLTEYNKLLDKIAQVDTIISILLDI